MKRALAVVALSAAFLMGGGVLVGAMDPASGSAVPDSVAAELRGGCAGVGLNSCWLIGGPPCPQWAYCNGTQANADPGSVQQPWCFFQAGDGNYYCLNCSATYVSCGGS